MRRRTIATPAFAPTAAVALAAAAAFAIAGPLAAQDGYAWENATELSFVSTGGNSSSSSLGLKASLTGTDEQNTFKLEVGGIRSETDVTTRVATGTPASFAVSETTVAQLTAENYFLRGRYDRAFTEAFAFAGAGWDRNTFSGIQNRFAVVAGFGRTLIDAGESGRLKIDLGATYTIQKDVDPEPGADDAFGGLRMTVDATRRVSESADYSSQLAIDENLEDTEDLRADWINSLTLAINQRLAFKTSLQILYDHLPSNLRVPLFDGGGTPTGTDVLTPGDKVDHIVTLTLVIKL
jgi:putative salt-induced outer membrane protein YdiY